LIGVAQVLDLVSSHDSPESDFTVVRGGDGLPCSVVDPRPCDDGVAKVRPCAIHRHDHALVLDGPADDEGVPRREAGVARPTTRMKDDVHSPLHGQTAEEFGEADVVTDGQTKSEPVDAEGGHPQVCRGRPGEEEGLCTIPIIAKVTFVIENQRFGWLKKKDERERE